MFNEICSAGCKREACSKKWLFYHYWLN